MKPHVKLYKKYNRDDAIHPITGEVAKFFDVEYTSAPIEGEDGEVFINESLVPYWRNIETCPKGTCVSELTLSQGREPKVSIGVCDGPKVMFLSSCGDVFTGKVAPDGVVELSDVYGEGCCGAPDVDITHWMPMIRA